MKMAHWGLFLPNVAHQMAAKVSGELNYHNYALLDFFSRLTDYSFSIYFSDSEFTKKGIIGKP